MTPLFFFMAIITAAALAFLPRPVEKRPEVSASYPTYEKEEAAATFSPTPTPTTTPTPAPEINEKPYIIEYGIPNPTQNFCSEGMSFKQIGVRKLNRQDFPYQILPSGGASCILSASEMFGVQVLWYSSDEKINQKTHIFFGQDTGLGVPREIFSIDGEDFAEDAQGYVVSAFIGRYDWELERPGKYYALVKTAYGEDRIDFEVI